MKMPFDPYSCVLGHANHVNIAIKGGVFVSLGRLYVIFSCRNFLSLLHLRQPSLQTLISSPILRVRVVAEVNGLEI